MRSTYSWPTQPSFPRPRSSTARLGSFQQAIHRLYHHVIGHFASAETPHTWPTYNTEGQKLWNAIDPVSGQSIREASAHDLRVWLEERHTWR